LPRAIFLKQPPVDESPAAGGRLWTIADYFINPQHEQIDLWMGVVRVPGHAVGQPRIRRAQSDPQRFACVSLLLHRMSTNGRFAPISFAYHPW
jgi:hypothetical protein